MDLSELTVHRILMLHQGLVLGRFSKSELPFAHVPGFIVRGCMLLAKFDGVREGLAEIIVDVVKLTLTRMEKTRCLATTPDELWDPNEPRDFYERMSNKWIMAPSVIESSREQIEGLYNI